MAQVGPSTRRTGDLKGRFKCVFPGSSVISAPRSCSLLYNCQEKTDNTLNRIIFTVCGCYKFVQMLHFNIKYLSFQLENAQTPEGMSETSFYIYSILLVLNHSEIALIAAPWMVY